MFSRHRLTRRHYILMALTIGLGGQLAGGWLLVRLLLPGWGSAAVPAAMGFCAVMTLPLVLRLRIGLPGETGMLGATLYGYYFWWAMALYAGLAAPVCFFLARCVGASDRIAATAALGCGFWAGIGGLTYRRMRARLRRIELAIPGWPRALDGYRIAQLSDIHMGPHTPPKRVRRWVDLINTLTPDLVAVTGDLVASGNHFIEAVAEELGRLRGRDGVVLCMGNHDYMCDHVRLVAALERAGIEVLRNCGRVVERSGACYWLGGVDDTWRNRHDVARSVKGRAPGVATVILAHDPILFEECAAHGASLVLSGHTHGGQLAIPIFSRLLNPASLSYRYTAGWYELGSAQLYVSRGAGTTGPPLRIGSPSEIVLVTLRSAEIRPAGQPILK